MLTPTTIKLAAGASILASILGFGIYIGKGMEKSASAKAIEEVRDNLYSCQQTVFAIEDQSSKRIESMQVELNRVSKNANLQIEVLKSNVVAANDSADSLRDKAKRIEDKYRQCTNASKPSTATDKAVYMPSDMLGELDKAAQQYAEYADRLEISNRACVEAYEAR